MWFVFSCSRFCWMLSAIRFPFFVWFFLWISMNKSTICTKLIVLCFMWISAFCFYILSLFSLFSPWNWLWNRSNHRTILKWKFLILLFFAFLWECCKNNKQAKSRNIKKSTSNIAPLSSFYFTFTCSHRRTHPPMMIARTRIRRLTTKKTHASHKSGITMA